MTTNPECTVVIPHLVGSRPLLACLHSLCRTEANIEVLLVDNASIDDSVETALKFFPEITVVRSDCNLGYAGGANLGLENAGGRWCIFINDDAVPAPGAIDLIIKKLREAPADDLPLIQPALHRSSEPEKFDYAGGAGGLIDRWGIPFALGRLFDHVEVNSGQYMNAGPLAWGSGCCLAGPTDVFRRLGGFEESFFAHFEEIDLCWRFRRSGGRVVSAPEAVVYHMGPSTLPTGARKTYLNYRNNIWTLRRNLPFRKLMTVLITRFLLDAVAALRWLVTGRPGLSAAIVRGWWAGVFRRTWSSVQPARSIQSERGEWGTFGGNIAIAVYLKGIRRATQLVDRVKGWDQVSSHTGRGEAGK